MIISGPCPYCGSISGIDTMGRCMSCGQGGRSGIQPSQVPPSIFPRPHTGWICPQCGTVNAPWMPTCGSCNPCNHRADNTTGKIGEGK